MTITVTVRIAIDDDTVAALAAKRHRPTALALEELVADCELRLSDAPKYLEGVTAVRVMSIDPLPTRPPGVTSSVRQPPYRCLTFKGARQP